MITSGHKTQKKNPNSNPIGKQFTNEDIIMVAGMKWHLWMSVSTLAKAQISQGFQGLWLCMI